MKKNFNKIISFTLNSIFKSCENSHLSPLSHKPALKLTHKTFLAVSPSSTTCCFTTATVLNKEFKNASSSFFFFFSSLSAKTLF